MSPEPSPPAGSVAKAALPLWAYVLIALLAAGLRIEFQRQYSTMVTYTNPVFVPDSRYYLDWAEHLREGQEFRPGDAYFMGPLYPHLLALVPRQQVWVVRGLQLASGVAVCLMLAAAASHLFGGVAGLIAGVLAAGYGPFWFFEAQLFPDALIVVLEAAWLLLLLRLEPERRWRLWALGGLLVGASCLARASSTLLIPASMAVVLLQHGRAGLRAAGIFALCALVPLGASLTRNRIVGGEWVLVSSNGGINFYIGNNKMATGSWVPVPDPQSEDGFGGRDPYLLEELSRRGQPRLKTGEASSMWYAKGWEHMLRRPGRTLKLLGFKLLLLFDSEELDVNEDLPTVRRFAPLLWVSVGFGLVGSLGMAGLLLGLVRRRGLALLVPLSVSAISGLLFFVTSRHRLSMVPPLIVLAGGAVVELIELARQARWRRFCLGIGGAAAIFVLSRASLLADQQRHDLQTYSLRKLAAAEQAMGRFEEAEVHLAEALALAPGRPGLLADRAALAYVRGRPAEAARWATEALAGRELPRARRLLGLSLLRLERFAEAAEQLAIASALEPRAAEVWESLGRARAGAGNLAGAEAAFRKSLEIEPQRESAHLLLTSLESSQGRLEPAIERLRGLLAAKPELAASAMMLAGLYRAAGRKAEAERLYEGLMERNPKAVRARIELGRMLLEEGRPAESILLLSEALKLEPRQQGVRVDLATALLREHKPRPALQLLEEERQIFGDSPVLVGLLQEGRRQLDSRRETPAADRD